MIHMVRLLCLLKLEWELIRSFPVTDEGEPDWAVFEDGPPDYICEVFSVLEERARATWPRLLNAQQEQDPTLQSNESSKQAEQASKDQAARPAAHIKWTDDF